MANARWDATVSALQAEVGMVAGEVALLAGTAAAGDNGGGALYFSTPNGRKVTAASNATPIVITTAAAHGLVAGQRVVIAGVAGNTAANGTWTVAAPTSTTFQLTGAVGNGVYTSGGAVGDGGSIIPSSSTTAGVWTRLSEVLYVSDFGAKGDYNLVTDTGTDDRTAISAAVAAAIASGKGLHFPAGNYLVSRYIDIAGARGLKISGAASAMIRYRSDDVSVVADAIAISIGQARSAFLLRGCQNVTIEGLVFQGNKSPSFDLVNVGSSIYQTRCMGTVIRNCVGYDGASFHQQDAAANSTGTGDSLAVSGTTVTLTDSAGAFLPGHVGLTITLSNCTNQGNNGVFTITSYLSATQVTFTNATPTVETSSFAWALDDGDRGTIIESCRIERMRAAITVPSHSKVLRSTFRHPMTPDQGGIISSFTNNAGTVTLSATNGTWDASVVGRYIKVAGSTSAGNNSPATGAGAFLITGATKRTRLTPATLTYANASGVTEAGSSTGTYWIPGGEKLGVGNGTTGLAHSAGITTLTAAAAAFTSADVGRVVRVSGASNAANNGAFIILTAPTSTTITYANSSPGAASEPTYSKIWSIDGWDASGPAGAAFGSSVFIYIFAGSDSSRGRENIEIAGNTFIGCRTYAVKASGSSSPIRAVHLHHNTAIECGGLFVGGADDSQEHAELTVENNSLIDVATGRPGWTQAVGIQLLGCRGARVDNNTLLYTRPAISSIDGRNTQAGNIGIQASQYKAGLTQPLEDFSASGNKLLIDYQSNRPIITLSAGIQVTGCGLVARYGTGGTLTVVSAPTMMLTDTLAFFSQDLVGATIQFVNAPNAGNNVTATVLSVPSTTTLTFTNASGVGGGVAAGTYRIQPPATKRGSTCALRNNECDGAASIAVSTTTCVAPEIVGTVWNNCFGVIDGGSVVPRIAFGRQIGRNSSNAALQVGSSTAWPIVHDNTITANGNTLNASQVTSCDVGIGIDNSTRVDHPLLGKRGRCKPTGGRAELVFAYGSGWVDGDRFTVAGKVCTYRATAPGAGEFNSAASLIALINGGGFIAEDYGVTLTGALTTGHIRVRVATPSAAANQGSADTISVLNPTAFVLPRNDAGGGEAICYTRGPATSATPSSSPVADKTVVWSPLCGLANSPRLHGYNAEGAALVTGGRAKGTITCIAKASFTAGVSDNVTIGDGINAPVRYYFDTVGAGGGTGTQVNLSTDTTAQQVATRLAAAINATQRTITAAVGTVATVDDFILTLTHNWPGAGGNATLTEAVVNAGFLVTGLVGGMTGAYELKVAGNAGACAVIQHGPQSYLQNEELCWELD